jgi:hypothetical protein
VMRATASHRPYDSHRVAQVGWERVTIWKNVCLFFWSRGTNHFEGGGSAVAFMDGVKSVCVVCVN